MALDAALTALNASVGIYETRFVDDIGLDHVDRFLVVDSSPDEVVSLSTPNGSWAMAALGRAYKQLTTRKIGGKLFLSMRVPSVKRLRSRSSVRLHPSTMTR